MEIGHKGQTIKFNIEYKKRKKIKIHIDQGRRITVLAPKGTKEEHIIELVKSKTTLILEKLKSMEKETKDIVENKYEDGDKLLYLGKYYVMNVIRDNNIEKNMIDFNNGQFTIILKEYDKDIIKKLIKRFYKKQCKKVILKRINHYDNYFHKKIRNIEIIESKNKWGSCNSNKKLDFNWRLIMAPIEIIDYVVVHEMCHLDHMNHLKSFWRLLGKIIPDYKRRSEWLQYYGNSLNI
ncbi:MAG: M48 family metallopeptidase [Anaeromicrobium sp.]|jgi:predicted metal-dependent hydrolase|uniref:M48 family metallopeptidase n=1 Tax=Anaeromicrobium sp. TaxID=1929132 RepID=UPI0025F8AB38|nr:SprT family zinc-dependent metalloprotease [Anaeromicrobium sp.]MCT4594696.1 M48 family metallopeptidase [Anaeromicrobium sp.]